MALHSLLEKYQRPMSLLLIGYIEDEVRRDQAVDSLRDVDWLAYDHTFSLNFEKVVAHDYNWT
jgi:hypothetical protein